MLFSELAWILYYGLSWTENHNLIIDWLYELMKEKGFPVFLWYVFTDPDSAASKILLILSFDQEAC